MSSAQNSGYYHLQSKNTVASISPHKLISAESSWKAKVLKLWNNLTYGRENSTIMSSGSSIRSSCSLQCSGRCSHSPCVVNIVKASVCHSGAEIFNPAVRFIFSWATRGWKMHAAHMAWHFESALFPLPVCWVSCELLGHRRRPTPPDEENDHLHFHFQLAWDDAFIQTVSRVSVLKCSLTEQTAGARTKSVPIGTLGHPANKVHQVRQIAAISLVYHTAKCVNSALKPEETETVSQIHTTC